MPLNIRPFDEEDSQKKRSNKSEKRLAKKTGGRRQPMSGALAGFKGDVKMDEWLLDLKETKHMSSTVKVEDLQKIDKEAMSERKNPALVLQFNEAKTIEKQWVVMPMSNFLELTGRGEQ